MKKWMILLFLLTIQLLSFSAVSAQGSGEVFISADKNAVLAGDEITFTISIREAKQIDRIQLAFEYDEAVLEYVESRFLISNVDIKQAVQKESKIGLVVVPKQPFDGSADVAALKFKVRDNAEKKRLFYTISNLTYGSESAGSFDDAAKPEIEIVGEFALEADKSFVGAEDTVLLSVKSNIKKMSGLQFVIDYPEEIFSLESGEFSENIRNNAMISDFEPAAKKALFVCNGDMQVDDVVFTAVLRVKKNVCIGNYSIHIKNIKAIANGADVKLDQISTDQIQVFRNFMLEHLSTSNKRITGNIYSNHSGAQAMMLVCFYQNHTFVGLEKKVLSGSENGEGFAFSMPEQADHMKIMFVNNLENIMPLETAATVFF